MVPTPDVVRAAEAAEEERNRQKQQQKEREQKEREQRKESVKKILTSVSDKILKAMRNETFGFEKELENKIHVVGLAEDKDGTVNPIVSLKDKLWAVAGENAFPATFVFEPGRIREVLEFSTREEVDAYDRILRSWKKYEHGGVVLGPKELEEFIKYTKRSARGEKFFILGNLSCLTLIVEWPGELGLGGYEWGKRFDEEGRKVDNFLIFEEFPALKDFPTGKNVLLGGEKGYDYDLSFYRYRIKTFPFGINGINMEDRRYRELNSDLLEGLGRGMGVEYSLSEAEKGRG